MSDTPQTDECVKENRHIRFLEEDHFSLNGTFTYTHPIVALCRKLERKLTAVTEQRDEARETVESLTTTAFDLLASLEKARDEREDVATWKSFLADLIEKIRYQETHNNVTKADEALQSLNNPNEP